MKDQRIVGVFHLNISRGILNNRASRNAVPWEQSTSELWTSFILWKWICQIALKWNVGCLGHRWLNVGAEIVFDLKSESTNFFLAQFLPLTETTWLSHLNCRRPKLQMTIFFGAEMFHSSCNFPMFWQSLIGWWAMCEIFVRSLKGVQANARWHWQKVSFSLW